MTAHDFCFAVFNGVLAIALYQYATRGRRKRAIDAAYNDGRRDERHGWKRAE